MKYSCIVVSHFGGPENLKLVVEDELPEPRANEMRVKILAAGVSFADILMRERVHPESWLRRTPFSPGWDLVGVIDKLGERVSSSTTWKLGQTVAALPIVGGYAEYICLPSNEIIPLLLDLTMPRL
jgi:NADPH:quinone reductase-like Zn-dependent oxidoreductase